LEMSPEDLATQINTNTEAVYGSWSKDS